MKVTSIILLSLLIFYLYVNYTKTIYVAKSKIQGEGLFASKHFTKDDIILENLFPHKNSDEELYEPISKTKFNE